MVELMGAGSGKDVHDDYLALAAVANVRYHRYYIANTLGRWDKNWYLEDAVLLAGYLCTAFSLV